MLQPKWRFLIFHVHCVNDGSIQCALSRHRVPYRCSSDASYMVVLPVVFWNEKSRTPRTCLPSNLYPLDLISSNLELVNSWWPRLSHFGVHFLTSWYPIMNPLSWNLWLETQNQPCINVSNFHVLAHSTSFVQNWKSIMCLVMSSLLLLILDSVDQSWRWIYSYNGFY